MKKKFACILLAIATFLFSGCVTFPVKSVVHSDPNKVTAIEVYYLEEGLHRNEKGWCRELGEEIDDIWYVYYEPCECEPIAYVNQDDYADFIADAKALPYTMTLLLIPAAVDPSFEYYDYVVRIVSGDEEELLCNKAGGDLAYCDETVWQNFLKKYIGEEAFAK